MDLFDHARKNRIEATTENPYFTVNRPLVSRSHIFQLKPLTEADLFTLGDHPIRRTGHHRRRHGRGRGEHPAPGDTLKDGDYHYDTIGAFIKSLCGSDPDAALYRSARMIYAGENLRFLFCRPGQMAGDCRISGDFCPGGGSGGPGVGRPGDVDRCFAVGGSGEHPSYAQHLLCRLLMDEPAEVRALCRQQLAGQTVPWRTRMVLAVSTSWQPVKENRPPDFRNIRHAVSD